MRQAIAHAEAVCSQNGARLTPNRRNVLEVLLRDHRPLGAYEITDLIDWQSRRAAVAQVYRALEFLAKFGLVHRIESLNAYVACNHQRPPHLAQFLVCENCHRVAETADPGLQETLQRLASSVGFTMHAPVIELKGVCSDCSAA